MSKVSVVIPVYNVEQYLPDALDSIVSQTLRDLEIICVNDGSTDRSKDILRDYASRDARFVLIDQPNRGLSAARNAGAAAAHGDYLYFFDSDDLLNLNALEELHSRAVADRLDVINFDAVAFFENDDLATKHAAYSTYYCRSGQYPDVMSGPQLVADMCNNKEYRSSVPLQFIRLEYYRSASLSFYEGILHEDNLFTFLCALQAERVAHVAKPYFHRRVRANSIMTTVKTAANFRGFLITYLEMLRFAIPRSFDEPTSRAVARLCAEMYRQAMKVYCGLSGQERAMLTPPDSTPEAILAFELVIEGAIQGLKTKAAQRDLKASEGNLKRIRNSKTFKLSQLLRKIVRFGR